MSSNHPSRSPGFAGAAADATAPTTAASSTTAASTAASSTTATSTTTAASTKAARALRITLISAAAACIVLGLIGLGIALLAGDDDEIMWPGLSLLALAQFVALIATGTAGWGLRRLRKDAEPRPVTDRVRATLRALEYALLILLVIGAAVWIVVRPSAAVSAVSSAIVGAQVALVLHLLRH
ncbi:MAG: hypothetical protein ACYC1Z_09960 [Georgenia sp.]